MWLGLLAMGAWTWMACSASSAGTSARPAPAPPRATPAGQPAAEKARAAADCPVFESHESGRCEDGAIDEVSGIAASTTLPGALWAHNDSGDGPRLFAVGRDGTIHGEVTLTGADAIDWEDMAAAPGRGGSLRDLVIGDVGDNPRQRDEVQLYRVSEPPLSALGGRVPARVVRVQLPDGPQDVEALFVDPRDGAIYLVAKRLIGQAPLYRVPGDVAPDTGTVRAERVGSVKVRFVTAADMSRQGDRIVLRNYGHAYLWDLAADESVAEALKRPPCPVELPGEPQGEAIAFADRHTLLLLSEQAQQPIFVLQEQVPDSPPLR